MREDRAHRAARHNDRTFGAEGATGADGNRGRQRLEHGDFRLHAAATEKNRFERFRYTMAADFFRAIARHQTDHHAADHRHENYKIAETMMIGRLKHGGELPVERNVGDHRNQPNQYISDHGAERADNHRHPGQSENPFVTGKVR